MQTLSGPLHICCVCFSELFKRWKTKRKKKGREGERVQRFHCCFSFFSISSADLANRPIVLLYSLVLFSFAAVVFLFISPSTVFFYFSQSVFPPCFERARKASLSLSDLIFLCNSHSRWPGKLPRTKEQRNECMDAKESKTREDRGKKTD